MLDEQLFHVVFYYQEVPYDDYVIAGIFTMPQDAELLVFNLKAKKYRSVARLELSLNSIKQFLMQERLGKLAGVLERMEKIHDDLKGSPQAVIPQENQQVTG